MGNTRSGTYRTGTHQVMRAFDQLPPTVRRALSEAAEDWVPQPFLNGLKRCGWNAHQCVIKVHQLDALAIVLDR